jgi:predicted anti-sigma-YlaC factor YlaD
MDCNDILIAVMSGLDRETDGPRPAWIDAHLAGCPGCRDAVAGMTRTHAHLERLTYDAPAADLWPAVEARLPAGGRSAARETLMLALIVPAALAWRAVQVSFDVPLSVWSVVMPLAAVVIVLRWLARDPLAISASAPELQQEGA